MAFLTNEIIEKNGRMFDVLKGALVTPNRQVESCVKGNYRQWKKKIHIRNIKRNIGDIGNHFNLRGHSIADLVVVAIERVNHRNPKKRDGLRKVRESLWIDRYDAVEFGSNTRD